MINIKLEIFNVCDKYIHNLIKSWNISWKEWIKLMEDFTSYIKDESIENEVEFIEELVIKYPKLKIPLFSLMEEYDD